MLRTASYRLANLQTDGQLTTLLTQYRAAGLSFTSITKLLNIQFGVEASRETVRAWIKALGIESDSKRTGPGRRRVNPPFCACGKFRNLDEKTGRCLQCGEWPADTNGDRDRAA